jgi:hypothetical protein
LIICEVESSSESKAGLEDLSGSTLPDESGFDYKQQNEKQIKYFIMRVRSFLNSGVSSTVKNEVHSSSIQIKLEEERERKRVWRGEKWIVDCIKLSPHKDKLFGYLE